MAAQDQLTDAYIDEVIKANEPYDPGVEQTQGIKMRELIKSMRNLLVPVDFFVNGKINPIYLNNEPLPTTYRLSLNITGLQEGTAYVLYVNGILWNTLYKDFAVGSNLGTITPSIQGYTLSPVSFGPVVMDQNRVLTFTATPIGQGTESVLPGAFWLEPYPIENFSVNGHTYTASGSGSSLWNQQMPADGFFAFEFRSDSGMGIYLNEHNRADSARIGVYTDNGVLYIDKAGVQPSVPQPASGDYVALKRSAGNVTLQLSGNNGTSWLTLFDFGQVGYKYLVGSFFNSRKIYNPQGMGVQPLSYLEGFLPLNLANGLVDGTIQEGPAGIFTALDRLNAQANLTTNFTWQPGAMVAFKLTGDGHDYFTMGGRNDYSIGDFEGIGADGQNLLGNENGNYFTISSAPKGSWIVLKYEEANNFSVSYTFDALEFIPIGLPGVLSVNAGDYLAASVYGYNNRDQSRIAYPQHNGLLGLIGF